MLSDQLLSEIEHAFEKELSQERTPATASRANDKRRRLLCHQALKDVRITDSVMGRYE